MKTFKEYIKETYIDPETGNNTQRKDWLTDKISARFNRGRTAQIGENETHTFHRVDHGEDNGVLSPDEAGSNKVEYYAKRKTGGHIDATINGHEIGDALHIGSMATRPDSTLKMSHFIHHLVSVHGKTVGAKHFSPAGHATLKKVGGMDGVETRHFRGNKEVGSDNEDWVGTNAHDATYMTVGPKHYAIKTTPLEESINESVNHPVVKYVTGSRAMNNALHHEHDTKFAMPNKSKPNPKAVSIMDGVMRSKIHSLDSEFNKEENKTKTPLVVHTGLPESPQKVFEMEAKHRGCSVDEVDHVHVIMPAYTSTSKNTDVAKKFATKGHVMEVHVPVGHQVIPVKDRVMQSNAKDSIRNLARREDEYLLHRGTTLKIERDPKVGNGVSTWKATVTGRKHQEI